MQFFSSAKVQLIVQRNRMANVARAALQKGQGLVRKEGPPTYAILSRFTRFLNGLAKLHFTGTERDGF